MLISNSLTPRVSLRRHQVSPTIAEPTDRATLSTRSEPTVWTKVGQFSKRKGKGLVKGALIGGGLAALSAAGGGAGFVASTLGGAGLGVACKLDTPLNNVPERLFLGTIFGVFAGTAGAFGAPGIAVSATAGGLYSSLTS